jgi:hypothetical protein
MRAHCSVSAGLPDTDADVIRARTALGLAQQATREAALALELAAAQDAAGAQDAAAQDAAAAHDATVKP